MAAIPEPTINTASLIDQWHEDNQEPPRPHMGASQLGHHCERYLWLSFRWVNPEKFSGRMLRLFRRGHNEEETIIEDLQQIGVEIELSDNQERVDFGNHVSGSLDGIAKSGVPESPNTPHLLEFKTHGKKSFDDLEKKGVEASKPIHYAQMQVYMLGANLTRALYVSVCKDDDRLYVERVRFNRPIAESLVDKGHRLVSDPRIPPPISNDSTWYQCKMCSNHDFCFKQKLPDINCRTCAHSTPMPDSTWRCERHQSNNIPIEFQRHGCDDHALHPDLVPWKMDPSSAHKWQPVYMIIGKKVINGPDGYLSREIVSNPQLCALNDKTTQDIKSTFNAEIIG